MIVFLPINRRFQIDRDFDFPDRQFTRLYIQPIAYDKGMINQKVTFFKKVTF